MTLIRARRGIGASSSGLSQPLFDANIVDSGSDGKTYWNVFNVEGESDITAQFATYATLLDMLNDTNRTGAFTPSQPLFDANIVGSGADIILPAAIPEPASLVLLGTALVGFGVIRRRRKLVAAEL